MDDTPAPFHKAPFLCRLLRVLPRLKRRIFFIVMRALFKGFFRVEVHGAENVAKPGQAAIYVVNHISLLDGLLIGLFLPGNPVFVINTHIAKKWWARFFISMSDHYTLDPLRPLSLKSLVRVIEEGRAVVIFPEGRLSDTGALMKVYDGPGLIADKTHAPLIPVRIDGAEYTPFSYMKGMLPRRWFTKILITILKPVQLEIPDHYRERVRRQYIADRLYDIMAAGKFGTAQLDKTLWQELVEARERFEPNRKILEDIERQPLSYRQLIQRAWILGRVFKSCTEGKERVGFLLPNMVAAGLAFFALQSIGRVPVMLNPAASKEALLAAAATTGLRTIITSRRFLKLAHLEEAAAALAEKGEVLYLEDIQKNLKPFDYILGALSMPLAKRLYRRRRIRPDDTAVILFTAGTTGAPKAVALSHRNLIANRHQVLARIDCTPKDVIFNPLPLHTPYGLSTGFLVPLFCGAKVFLFPSPLQYQFVSEIVYEVKATILFGTDTSLMRYAEAAHPYDFYCVRYVFAGAERLRDETRHLWAEKFGLRLFEGYGATEAGPTMAMNTPMYNKAGTVGKFLPSVEYKIEPLPGAEGGALFVRGPNVMQGYMTAPGELRAPADGWFETGDIVTLSEDGFVNLIGRQKL